MSKFASSTLASITRRRRKGGSGKCFLHLSLILVPRIIVKREFNTTKNVRIYQGCLYTVLDIVFAWKMGTSKVCSSLSTKKDKCVLLSVEIRCHRDYLWVFFDKGFK